MTHETEHLIHLLLVRNEVKTKQEFIEAELYAERVRESNPNHPFIGIFTSDTDMKKEEHDKAVNALKEFESTLSM